MRQATADERAAWTAIKTSGFDARMPPPPAQPRPSVTDDTIAWAAAQPAGALLDVTLVLTEPGFDWSQFQGADDDARAALIVQRQMDLAPAQGEILSRLEQLGAVNVQGLWIANLVMASVTSDMLPAIAAWPSVIKIAHLNPPTLLGQPNDAFDGYDVRRSTRADTLIAQGYEGGAGGGSTGSGRVTIADHAYANSTTEYHYAMLNSSGATRINHFDYCSSSSCTGATNVTSTTHDMTVMSVMAGSIEEGQDPSYPGTGTGNQVDRSGMSSQSQPSFYEGGTMQVALQQAVSDGMQIINMSWGVTDECSSTDDENGMNEILESAFAAGVLVVNANGDGNGTTFEATPGCNSSWPAQRTEVLAVNGYQSFDDSSGEPPSSPTMGYDAWSTSYWPVSYWSDAYSRYLSVGYNVNLGPTAPGDVTVTDTVSGSTYSYNAWNGWWAGSSFAAPIVAGAGALLLDAFYHINGGVRPGYWLKSDLMMLTDGYSFTSYSGSQTAHNPAGISPYSGTGRLKLHYPGDDSFPGGSWAWTWEYATVSNGQVISKTIPSDIQHYQFALYWIEDDLTQIADIDVEANTLNSDGSFCETIASQEDSSINNAIHLQASDFTSCGGDIMIQILMAGIPPGQTRKIYYSDLYDHEETF